MLVVIYYVGTTVVGTCARSDAESYPCRIPRENIVTRECVCLSRLSQLPQKHAHVRLTTALVNKYVLYKYV